MVWEGEGDGLVGGGKHVGNRYMCVAEDFFGF